MISQLKLSVLPTLLLLLMCCGSPTSHAQVMKSINLDSCVEQAVKNHPLQSHAQIVEAIGDNTLKQANASSFPQLTVVSKATFQSEVTELNFSVPGIHSTAFPKDNYSFGIQLNQVLYDFGRLAQYKATVRSQVNSDRQKNTVDLYEVRSQIVQQYGSVLVARTNIQILLSYLDNLKKKYVDVQSQVDNGVTLQSTLDVLFVEIEKTQQQLIEANHACQSQVQILALYTSTDIDTTTAFKPLSESALYASHDTVIRPELTLFAEQIDLLDAKIKLENRKKLPLLYVYGEGAYGRPGYNFLNQDLRLYGIAGIGISWNLNNLYTNSLSEQNLAIGKNMVEEQKALFELQQNKELIKQRNEMDKLIQLIENDTSIIEKRKAIVNTFADQMNNGIIAPTEYIAQLYSLKQAELSASIHEIQLQLATINFNITSGTQ